MTDQEIIKALRVCGDGDCDKCAYVLYARCYQMLVNDAADRLEELTENRSSVMMPKEDV